MADSKNGKWTKARVASMLATRKANAATRLKKDIKNVKIILNDLTPDDRADAIANAMRNAKTKTKPLTAHYVGEVTQPERPQVDVAKLESEAFRRGMFTALQMVIDSLVRELR